MNTSITYFNVDDHHNFRNKMLNRANRFNIFCFLDNNGYNSEEPAFECMLALGSRRQVTLEAGSAFATLQSFFDEQPGWLFGHLGFSLKGETTGVCNTKKSTDGFGDGFFFEPEIILRLTKNKLSIIGENEDAHKIYESISSEETELYAEKLPSVLLTPMMSKVDYLKAIQHLKEHIHRGDCYEINYCHYFSGSGTKINVIDAYLNLTNLSPAPFAALYKLNEHYCLCSSPERYLRKSGKVLLSQPVKGTRRREADKEADEKAKAILQSDAKERSENVMVVDLVRNDLSKICVEGSVSVQELFGIYTFPQVHQMISSLTGNMPDDLHWTEALKATFPMGSMTGAPKKRVLELIDRYETQARGLFSGSIGYITPEGDFDFNVVIRSIFYDDVSHQVLAAAGGGITFYSNAEAEYEESLLKVTALRNVLKGNK